MYYIIQTEYVGPDSAEKPDLDRLEISTSPTMYVGSNRVCIDDVAGNAYDYLYTAHGEHETIEQARLEIARLCGDMGFRGPIDDDDDDAIVETYLPNKHEPISRSDVYTLEIEQIEAQINADTTDAEIESLASDFEADANDQGITYGRHISDIMAQYRDALAKNRD